MKTRRVEDLLSEVKIRFGENWEECELLRYVLDSIFSINLREYYAELSETFGFNRNGKIYDYKNGKYHWTTAKITEKPEKWVVERDEKHPMWERFIEWYRANYINGNKAVKYFTKHAVKENVELTYFKNHQYITLDQWAELILDEPKDGDWCLFWDIDDSDLFGFVLSRYGGESDGSRFKMICGLSYRHCKKLSPELSAMLEKEIEQIKPKQP